MRKLKYSDAINEAIFLAMELSSDVITFGLGVPDPKGVFGTTLGLQEKFGKERVFDMPTSENAMTGIGIGCAIDGLRPIMVHQRVDFFLLALDQLFNNAAKWNFMFGGNNPVPITIRLIIGHGWGQGPTHSQNLQSIFSHIPGLKVVMPTTAYDAKGMLLESIFDDSPVIFLEHRWLHNLESFVPEGDFRVPIGKSHIVKSGEEITIVSMSYMTIEAIHAVEELERKGVSCELIDLRSTSPVDWTTIINSVKKTGKILTIDSASASFSVSSEIISKIATECHHDLDEPPCKLAMPDIASPTSFGLTSKYYFGAKEIFYKVTEMLKKEIHFDEKQFVKDHPHDVPGEWFSGPF